jgi:hypothetical protein
LGLQADVGIVADAGIFVDGFLVLAVTETVGSTSNCF